MTLYTSRNDRGDGSWVELGMVLNAPEAAIAFGHHRGLHAADVIGRQHRAKGGQCGDLVLVHAERFERRRLVVVHDVGASLAGLIDSPRYADLPASRIEMDRAAERNRHQLEAPA